MKVIAAATALLLLVGCASFDRYESELSPGDDANHWHFKAKAGVDYPEDSPRAETIRLGWLEAWMTEAGACPAGYEVTERRAVPYQALLGTVHTVFYTAQCVG